MVDIKAIKEKVDLPVIGIIKQVYDDSDVYITPTMKEVDALVEIGCEIIAVDATDRLRPNGVTFEAFFTEVRAKYPDQLFMADTSCFEEGKRQRNWVWILSAQQWQAIRLIQRVHLFLILN